MRSNPAATATNTTTNNTIIMNANFEASTLTWTTRSGGSNNANVTFWRRLASRAKGDKEKTTAAMEEISEEIGRMDDSLVLLEQQKLQLNELDFDGKVDLIQQTAASYATITKHMATAKGVLLDMQLASVEVEVQKVPADNVASAVIEIVANVTQDQLKRSTDLVVKISSSFLLWYGRVSDRLTLACDYRVSSSMSRRRRSRRPSTSA